MPSQKQSDPFAGLAGGTYSGEADMVTGSVIGLILILLLVVLLIRLL